MPLTADRAKPAVPFGGQYRLIDFALSNLINSQLRQIVVLTQYKSHSLDRHVSQTWRLDGITNSYVASVPAQQRLGKRWFSGSADAILQSLNLLRDEKPDIVVVVGADHVYRMDFGQMIEAHIDSGAPATVAAIRQPIGLADQFGVIEVEADDPTRIARVPREADRPDRPARLPRRGARLDGQLRLRRRRAHRRGGARRRPSRLQPRHGRRHHPRLRGARNEAAVYDFSNNDVPGIDGPRPLLLAGCGDDRLVLRGPPGPHLGPAGLQPVQQPAGRSSARWLNSPPAKFVRDGRGALGTTIDSIVSLGSRASRARTSSAACSGRGPRSTPAPR